MFWTFRDRTKQGKAAFECGCFALERSELEALMFAIEFLGVPREGAAPEVTDRMETNLTDLPHIIAHAKSLFSNVIVQRTHKVLPHGFRIVDPQGVEVARWSIDDS
jgi:hypothetical protein